MDPDTKEREVKSLVAYHRRYPESRLMIITMDEETDIQIDDATVSGSAFIHCIIEKSCSNTLLFCCYSLFPAIRKYFPVFF